MGERLARYYERLPFKTIDRYLMRQFLLSYVICAATVIGLFVVIDGVGRLEYFLRQDEFLGVVLFKYFRAIIPVLFTKYLGPVLTLMASMFAITILNKGSEIIPLKTAGLSIQRILAPFFLMALLLGCTMVLVQEYVLPNLKEEIQQAMSFQKRSAGITNIHLPDSSGNLISVRRYYPKKKQGVGVEVRRISPQDSTITEDIRAQEIVWRGGENGYWVLRHGQRVSWDDRGYVAQNGEYEQRFEEEPFATDMRPEDMEAKDQDIPYLSHSQLSHQIRRHEHLKHVEVKLHRRYAFPMANLILLLLGLPLVLRGENKSVVLGLATAMAISAVYLFSDAVCADLGNKGALPPMLAAWLPVLFFGALGLTLFDGMES